MKKMMILAVITDTVMSSASGGIAVTQTSAMS